MIYGRTNVLAWFDTLPEGYVFFQIYRKGKIESGNGMFTNKDDANTVKSDSRQKLDNYLRIIGSGEFEIVVNDKPLLTTKGRLETPFTLSQHEVTGTQQQPAVSGIGGVPEGYVSKAEAEAIAEKKFAELLLKKENEDLKAKVVALEKDNKTFEAKLKSPWQEVISGLAPYAPGILKSLGIVPEPLAQVAGHTANTPLPNNQTTDMANEQQQPANEAEVTEEQKQQQIKAVNDFVHTLAAAYPDTWVDILTKLTNAVATDKGKIDMALKFL